MKRDARKSRRPRWLMSAVAVLVFVAAAYLLLPFGEQRMVLLGSDAGRDGVSRTDVMLVTRADGGMLAVPRDTLVEIPWVGQDKINAAFAYGGPGLAVETLESLLGVPVENYAVLDFGGVEEIVNEMDGVTVDVESPITYQLTGRFVTIPAGEQTLNGHQALAYVRYRGGPTADIGRIENQQKFLAALAREATAPSKLLHLPGAAGAAFDNAETNMNPVEAARFVIQMWLWGDGRAEIYPGNPQYIDGVSYWVPDKESGRQVVEETVE